MENCKHYWLVNFEGTEQECKYCGVTRNIKQQKKHKKIREHYMDDINKNIGVILDTGISRNSYDGLWDDIVKRYEERND